MLKKTYYIIENEIGEEEGHRVTSLKEARAELKRCLKYYKDNMSNGAPPYRIFIVKHTEIDKGDYVEDFTEEVK